MFDDNDASTSDAVLIDLAASFEHVTSSYSSSSASSSSSSSYNRTSFSSSTKPKQQFETIGEEEGNSNLPTPLMIYKAGGILCNETCNSGRSVSDTCNALSHTYDEMITSLPRSYASKVIFKDINTAFVTLCKGITAAAAYTASSSSASSSGGVLKEELYTAIRSICGVYSHSAIACELGFNAELCVILVTIYDILNSSSNNNNKKKGGKLDENETTRMSVLQTLSCLLLNGLILPYQSEQKRNNKTDSNDNNDHDEDEDDYDDGSNLRRVMEVIQTLTSEGHKNCCLGDLQEWQKQQQQQQKQHKDETRPSSQQATTITATVTTLIGAVESTFNESPQRDYLVLMLSSCPTSSASLSNIGAGEVATGDTATFMNQTKLMKSSQQRQQKPKNSKSVSTLASATEMGIQLRIKQVHDVLPHLGEGYIEVALACYDGDPTETISALLESETADPSDSGTRNYSSSLHPRLRALDKSLPARRATDNAGDAKEEEEEEAKHIQKLHVQRMEQRAEEEAFALSNVSFPEQQPRRHNEYMDDYDDQYDGIGEDGGGAGVANDYGNMYDMDLNAIRTYNRLAREAERENAFWEENRNLNREIGRSGRNEKDDTGDEDGDAVSNSGEGEDGDDNEKKYRGPDKGKGGRVIGPDGKYVPLKRGGKKGRQQQQKQQPVDGGGLAAQGGKKKAKGGSGGGDGGGGGGGQQKSSGPGEMSKIQKRRKNDNKAKIANHHRKERAQKKQGMAGM